MKDFLYGNSSKHLFLKWLCQWASFMTKKKKTEDKEVVIIEYDLVKQNKTRRSKLFVRQLGFFFYFPYQRLNLCIYVFISDNYPTKNFG